MFHIEFIIITFAFFYGKYANKFSLLHQKYKANMTGQ